MNKFISLSLVFILGVVAGRLTAPHRNSEPINSKGSLQTQESPPSAGVLPVREAVGTPKSQRENSAREEIGRPLQENSGFVRTDQKAKESQIRKVFDRLMQANHQNNIDEQNRLFRELEALDPKHEKVFQAKVTFLQDDDDWDGAHKVLEECVSTIPNSVYCLQRLSNIRSSTIDDKIRYGSECLRVAKNDPFCLVDYAIALHSKGDSDNAKKYFELALSLPAKSEGYHRDYILYHYGITLESLSLNQKAKEALTEACRLGMKPACVESENLGKVNS